MIESWIKESPQELLQQHKIAGWLFVQKGQKQFKSQWAQQYTHNTAILKELQLLGLEAKKRSLPLIVLKGFSLMPEVYSDVGERFASDVDIYVSPRHWEKSLKLLKDSGFTEVAEKKWQGNQHKVSFSRALPQGEMVIECHHDLFWHTSSTFYERTKPHPSIEGFFRLKAEEELIYLCAHYGFQHNFLKLFWLVDIATFLKLFGEHLSWDLLVKRASDLGVLESFRSTIKAAHQMDLIKEDYSIHFPKSWRSRLLDHWVTPEFLLHPKKLSWRYQIVKFLVKDRLKDAFKYTFLRILSAF